MSNDTTVLRVKLDDLGTIDKTDNKLKNFRGTYDSLQKVMNKGLAYGGGSGGSGRGGGGGGWKNSGMGIPDYDRARGSAGSTGASGRDFANQARGLDGLVRLYATYAANLFAAGAAFRALSDAADTSNMIQGMNQLGAASGMALGTIAKKLVQATDGAISMREAMEATTKGTAAGLTAKQMEQLGQVANKASKALGIGMPDAISRLTRGISKLEPELLDELGLFTKIGPATENYARSIGKTTGSLTDFERRQSFANAVLKEGIDKFNAIDIAANPYDKLLSSLKNAGQTIGEMLNKFLGPLVDLLSSSPTALMAGIGFLASTIVKQALPAIGNYREQLSKTAELSKSLSDKKLDLATTATAKRSKELLDKRDKLAQAKTDKIDELAAKLQSTAGGQRRSITAILDPSVAVQNISEESLKRLDREGKLLGGKTNIYKEIAAAIRSAQLEEKKFLELERTIARERLNPGMFGPVGYHEGVSKKAKRAELSSSIISNAADTASIAGFGAALKGIKTDVTVKELGYLRASYTAVAAASTAAAVRIGQIVGSMGQVGMVIMTFVGLFQLVDVLFTSTAKQAAAFSKALDELKDSGDNAARTLAALNKQPGIATSSIKGVNALYNAMQGITDATTTSIMAFEDLQLALSKNKWDSFWNTMWSYAGKDAASKFAKDLGQSLQSSLALLNTAGLGEEATTAYKAALGVESLDIDTVSEAFKKGKPTIEAYEKEQKKLNNTLGESNNNLQAFKTATEGITKAYDEFIQSTASSNPLFKIGDALQTLSLEMSKVARGGLKDIDAAFNDLADNPKKIASFGEDFVNRFVEIRTQFKSTFTEISQLNQDILKQQAEIDKQQAKVNEVGKRSSYNFLENYSFDRLTTSGKSFYETDDYTKRQAQDAKKVAEDKKKIAEELKLTLDTKVFKQAQDLFVKGISDSFVAGAELIKVALGQAYDKAKATVAQAGLGALTGERAAAEAGRIKQDDFKIQLKAIDTNIDQILATERLTATMDVFNTGIALQKAKDSGIQRDIDAATSMDIAANTWKKELNANKTGSLNIAPTGNSLADAQLEINQGRVNKATAAQEANRIGVDASARAAGIETQRAIGAGKLEDLQKFKTLTSEINQLEMTRLGIMNSITIADTAASVSAANTLESKNLISKQESEIAGYNKAIKDAKAINTAAGKAEVDLQKGLLDLAVKKQKIETNTTSLQARLKFQAAELDDATKLDKYKSDITQQEITRLSTLNSISGFATEENLQSIISIENRDRINKQLLERIPLENAIKNLISETGEYDLEKLTKQKSILALVLRRQQAENDNKGLIDANKLIDLRFEKEQKLAEYINTRKVNDFDNQSALLSVEQERYNVAFASGAISGKNAEDQRKSLEQRTLLNEIAKQENDLIFARATKLAELEKRASQGDTEDMGAAAIYLRDRAAAEEDFAAKIANQKIINDGKKEALNLLHQYSDRQLAYGEVFKNSFSSMGDAIVEFTKTGKLNFKGLVDSMLEGLIRYEMQQQAMMAYESFRPGMNTFLSSIFGSSSSSLGTSSTPWSAMPINGFDAKGGVYDAGLKMYAKGGMFTNSVVDQPTLFKFAKGTGMMGEAGPEAIMPLKRDSNGNLGVRGGNGGNNVDVVVNNYGNEKATTKETTDSRGNRRIEVIVGDMVASEVARPGSPVQQSLTGSFNNRPALARR